MTAIIFTTSLRKTEEQQRPEERFAATAFEMLVTKKIREQLEDKLELTPEIKVVTVAYNQDSLEQTVFVGDYDEAMKTAIKDIIQDVWTESLFWELGVLLQLKDVIEDESNQDDSSRLVRKVVYLAPSHHAQIQVQVQMAFRANEEYVHAMNKLVELVDKTIDRCLGQE